MKAKLYKVQLGSFSELVVALSHQDAKDTVDSKKMGQKSSTILGIVEYDGNQVDGLTHYKLIAENLASDFGSFASVSNRVYSSLSEHA